MDDRHTYQVINTPSWKKGRKHEERRRNELIETKTNAQNRPRRNQAKQVIAQESKTVDKIFGEMVTKLLEEIPESYLKDMVKLEIQKQLLRIKHMHPKPKENYPQHIRVNILEKEGGGSMASSSFNGHDHNS